jgi:hypothetical protein
MVLGRKFGLLSCALFGFISGILCEHSSTPIEIDLRADWTGVPFVIEVMYVSNEIVSDSN